MHFTSTILYTSTLLSASATASLPQVVKRQQVTTCDEPTFILCPPNPPASSSGGGGGSGGVYVPPYSLGPSPFEFIKGIGGSVAAAAGKRQEQAQFCCNPKLECHILTDYKVYICLDNSTSDFFMNDGSNGNAASGMYYNAPGDVNINIFTGDYVYANGTRGNGYDDTGSPRPTREVTGSIPQPTGDVVKNQEIGTASVTAAPTSSGKSQSTKTSAEASATSAVASAATSAGSAAASKTPNAGGALSVPLFGQVVMIFLGLKWLL